MSYKLCDTCEKIELKGLNLFSENNEDWNDFPHPLPVLGRTDGSQQIHIDMGKPNAECLIYYWGSKEMFDNLNLEYPDSYIDSMNNGLMKLDKHGCCEVSLNCPQPYKDKGESYISHIHIIVSDKKMSRWKKQMYSQNVLCFIDRTTVNHHIKKGDRLLINALPKEYFEKAKLPDSFNLDYSLAKNMSEPKLKKQVKDMVSSHKTIKKMMTHLKLKLTEVPIIVYCYDKKCDASHRLANELYRAGFTNIIDYTEGILGYMGRTRYE